LAKMLDSRYSLHTAVAADVQRCGRRYPQDANDANADARAPVIDGHVDRLARLRQRNRPAIEREGGQTSFVPRIVRHLALHGQCLRDERSAEVVADMYSAG